MKYGNKASDNPWQAATLEWTTAPPPPHDNFGGRTPVVYHGPYEYSVPGAPRDYVMQTDPATVAAHRTFIASYTPTVSIDGPRTSTGGDGVLPPDWGGGADNFGSPFFDVRLRRARLGLVVGLTGIAMIFISFTSAYVVRQGLPTLDPRTNVLLHDWFPVPLPRLFLINTLVLLISTFTMELARRQAARKAGLTQLVSVSGRSVEAKMEISWL